MFLVVEEQDSTYSVYLYGTWHENTWHVIEANPILMTRFKKPFASLLLKQQQEGKGEKKYKKNY